MLCILLKNYFNQEKLFVLCFPIIQISNEITVHTACIHLNSYSKLYIYLSIIYKFNI